MVTTMPSLQVIEEKQQEFPAENGILELLREVMDPEIPALNVIEMGIVRGVTVQDGGVTVAITPTYSGCPAMDMISLEIRRKLETAGYDPVEIKTQYAPPWTSDWISQDAKKKLIQSGIAPPPPVGTPEDAPLTCPYCGSTDTELRSIFGCTACKALHFCNACRQPFESFKAI